MKARKATRGRKQKTLRASKSSASTDVLTDNGMMLKRKRASKRK
jgi:hypothetical protein